MFNSRSVIGTRQELGGLLLGGSRASTDGFDIQVGRSVGAQTIHVPQCVLKLCPILSNLLKPGCRIVNADPVVFAIIIGHLQTISNFGFISFSAPGHLPELTIGDESLLNFAKAWHVLDMLRKPGLQDKLFKVYRTYYLNCLEDRSHHQQDAGPSEPKPLESEPFVYLRNNVGYHSKAEKFMVDFHAGLMQKQTELKRDDFKLLPPEIAALIRDRWLELCGRVRKDSHHSDFGHDRIVAHDPCYKIIKNEAIQHGDLQVQYLYGGAGGTFGLNPTLSTSTQTVSQASRRATNRHQNRLEVLIERRKRSQSTRSGVSTALHPPPPQDAPASFEPPLKPRLENPFEASTPRQQQRDPSSSISPTQLPPDHGTPTVRPSSLAIRPAHRRSRNETPRAPSVSFAPDLPSRAPLAADNPGRAQWARDILDVEAADGGSGDDLFAARFRWDDLPADGFGDVGAFGVLDFAA